MFIQRAKGRILQFKNGMLDRQKVGGQRGKEDLRGVGEGKHMIEIY